MIPKAPDVKKPVIAKPMTNAAGTKTGLKITKSSVVIARPMSVASRVSPARRRRVPPTGRRVTNVRT